MWTGSLLQIAAVLLWYFLNFFSVQPGFVPSPSFLYLPPLPQGLHPIAIPSVLTFYGTEIPRVNGETCPCTCFFFASKDLYRLTSQVSFPLLCGSGFGACFCRRETGTLCRNSGALGISDKHHLQGQRPGLPCMYVCNRWHGWGFLFPSATN